MKTSLLDPKILEFLRIALEDDVNEQGPEYFLEDFTLNWVLIKEDFFQEIDYQETLSLQDECLKLKYEIEPILKESLKMTQKKVQFAEQIRKFCDWTLRTEDIIQQFEASSDQSSVQVLEDILFLTSLLENSLGNIFWSLTGKVPPHLLKDLLDTKEVKDVFGLDQIFFLQLILGTPKGVNLRNVVWHGFPSFLEVSPCYSSILFVIIISLGKTILNFPVKSRAKINYISLFSQINFEFLKSPAKFSKLQKTLESPDSLIIPKSHNEHWLKVLEYYKVEDFYSGILLLLPELELLLRCIYGQLNQVPITAHPDQYYIIMDTIYHEYVVTGTDSPFKLDKSYNEVGIINKIHQKFPIDLIKLFHDVFESPDGPRIRDKMSHGEVRKEDLNHSIFEKLLGIVEIILHLYSEDRSSFRYESKFHINCKLSLLYNEMFETLEDLPIKLLIPAELTKDFDWNDFDPNFKSFPTWELKKIDQNIKICFRIATEGELVKIQYNILEKLKISVENLKQSYTERIQLFEAKQLRTSRRKTLTQMLNILPHILQGFKLIMKVVALIFNHLQTNNKVNGPEKLMRYLKFLLKYIENMVQYLNVNHNKWIHSKETTTSFLNYVVFHRSLLEKL